MFVECNHIGLGKLKDVVFSASSVWARADKRLKVTVRLDDLSVFSFSSSNSTPNLSAWLDQEDFPHGGTERGNAGHRLQ